MTSAPIYEIEVQTLAGQTLPLRHFAGQLLLIVNTASACGFTPQYEGLQQLFTAYKDRGFVVLGFPCNQFGNQEPGDATQIQQFCKTTYDISFPMFAKVDVNGSAAHPLFEHLKKNAPGILGTEAIKWNFTKFLVGRDGQVIGRYAPATKPQQLVADIEAHL